MSARRLDDKTFRIDGAELSRVYEIKPAQRSDTTLRNVPQREEQAKKSATLRASETEFAVLRMELEAAKAALSREREERTQERETTRETVEDLRRRLDAEQVERRALQRQLMPPEKPHEPDKSPEVVDELRKRLEEVEGQMVAAVTALERVQERAVEAVGVVTPAKPSRGFLGRLWGR